MSSVPTTDMTIATIQALQESLQTVSWSLEEFTMIRTIINEVDTESGTDFRSNFHRKFYDRWSVGSNRDPPRGLVMLILVTLFGGEPNDSERSAESDDAFQRRYDLLVSQINDISRRMETKIRSGVKEMMDQVKER